MTPIERGFQGKVKMTLEVNLLHVRFDEVKHLMKLIPNITCERFSNNFSLYQHWGETGRFPNGDTLGKLVASFAHDLKEHKAEVDKFERYNN